MEEIKAPKKERRFLKGLGDIALTLVRELVLGVGKKLINKVGNKKQGLSIALIILACSVAFAQYPATGNKQRLGYQTTGDGLVWRGRASDTVALKSSTINNSYVILDTVNNVMIVYIKTKGGWNYNNADTIIVNNNTDTTFLSSRINLKLNISDTVSLSNRIDGKVSLNGTETINGSKSFNNVVNILNQMTLSGSVSGLNKILGKNTDGNGVGDITVGTGLSLTSNTLNATVLDTASMLNPYWRSGRFSGTLALTNGGTGATSASAARTALGATVRGANTFLLTDIGSISFLRYNSDNTVSQRGADGMRSDLGGTTIGQSIFTLTNPSAITFPRFNADNTVTALDAATFRTAIGAGTGNGNGTVTSVTGSLPISSSGGATPNITITNAGVSTTGVVTASTQTFGGAKTFNGDINGSSALNMTGFSTLTGGASVGTLATTSTLTRVLGINSSNAIGELSLGTGMSVGSGILSVQAAGASQTGLMTSFTQVFGGNKTFNGTVTLASASGTATSVIGRSSTGQVVDLTLGSGLSLSSGTLTATAANVVNIYLAINGPGITLSSSFGDYSHWYVNINQSSTVSITLPSASGNTNKTLVIKNSGAGAVNSNSTNVEPLNSTTLTTSILVSGGGKFATLVSNGTNWIIMQAN